MLGAMATGVAHEFNNLLTIVLASLHRFRRPPGRARARAAGAGDWGVRQAGRRSEQMLSFGRRENSQLQLADLNEVVGEFERWLAMPPAMVRACG